MEGIALAESFKPDVIFLDVKMPGMDGLDVLARLQEDDPGAIVITFGQRRAVSFSFPTAEATSVARAAEKLSACLTAWRPAALVSA